MNPPASPDRKNKSVKAYFKNPIHQKASSSQNYQKCSTDFSTTSELLKKGSGEQTGHADGTGLA
jgi:hypothetical protein